MSVSIEDVCRACEMGSLDQLKAWKAASQLPDLMQRNQMRWYPHEIAVRSNRLEIVKWLVQDSGQSVDVTAGANTAIRWSAKNGRLDAVEWLVVASGQLAEMLALPDRFWLDSLPEELQQTVAAALAVFDLLEKLSVPVAARNQYLLSPVCQVAVASGLVSAVDDLEQLTDALTTRSGHKQTNKL